MKIPSLSLAAICLLSAALCAQIPEPKTDALVSAPEIPGVFIPEGSELTVQATFKDLQIKSPTALTFDDQGRIFVSETHRFRHGVQDNRYHLYWYLEDLAIQRTEERRALHEKWQDKVSLEFMTEKSELIRLLEDTTGDGKIDKSSVFADGFNDVLDGTGAGVFFYDGCLYFACIPKIHKLRDTTGDGVADERKIVEEGLGVRVSISGHDLNGFVLGPDGRIYGTIGDRGFALITKEGVEYDYPNEGAAFRFEPDGTGFEVFHTGLRNPKEIAFDDFGNPFSVDNNADMGDAARIVYLVEGGDSGWQMEHQTMFTFHRQIGLENLPPNRWMAEKMWELRNDTQPAYILPPAALLTNGPSGLTYHPGTGFLESERNRFLICDYKGSPERSGIWSFQMTPDGAGMKLVDARTFLWGVAATDVEYSFDGKIFITDFINGWQSHDAGRLISVDAGANTYRAEAAAQTAKLVSEGFDQRGAKELAALLSHPDQRVRLRAQVALTRKDDAIDHFEKATKSAELIERIHGVWGLGILARRGAVPRPFSEFSDIPATDLREKSANLLAAMLNDPDPEIRAQVLRVIGDAPLAGDTLPLGALLSDPSPRVRFFAAIAIGKFKALGQYSAVVDFIRRNNNRDLYLRHAGIYALQHITTKPFQLGAFHQEASPAVRLAALVALRRQNSTEVGRFINDPEPMIQDESVRAIYDKNMTALLPRVAALLDKRTNREWTTFMQRRLIHAAYRVGGTENATRLLAFIADENAPDDVRKEAIRLIKNWEEPHVADQLTGIYRPIPARPLDTLNDPLLAAMPSLLSRENFVISGALDFIGQYLDATKVIEDEMLRGFIANPELEAETRAKALALYIARGTNELNSFLVRIAADPIDELAIAAITGLAENDPATSIPVIETAIVSGKNFRAQQAWKILATIPGEQAATVFTSHLAALKASQGISPFALELLAAAESRTEPAVKEALTAFQKSTQQNNDPLAKFATSLEGGDPERGAALFTSHPSGQCMRCHKSENPPHRAGGDAGPNLTGLANRHDSRYFLESMVLPAAVITPGYGIVSITFKNEASLSGNLITEEDTHIDIFTPDEKLLRIQRDHIASMTPAVSSMPSMEHLLKPEEMRDLVAWMATLKQPSKPVKYPDPEIVDPTKLPGAKTQSSFHHPTADNPFGQMLIATEEPAAIDPELMKLGQQQYLVCGACHGQSGEGGSAGPPLAGSEWVTGPAENLIRIQLRGLTGPIVVKGVEYNFPAGMMAMAYQNDEQIAAVLTYIRNSFGNSAPIVTPEEVAAIRPEVGQPPVTADQLIPPIPVAPAGPMDVDNGQNLAPTPDKYANMGPSLGIPIWIPFLIFIFTIGCFGFLLRK